jgi:malonyl CoA-acyl carrier protein transacylase
MEAFVFPGQGSQVRGMGKGLFDKVAEFRDLEKQIDDILGYSIITLCLEDPQSRLKETQFTQPSLYVVNALHFYSAISEGRRPSYLAGHSLGEYNALLASGGIDFLTGLRIVKRRGELMAQARNGAMAAVIGFAPERVAELLRRNGLDSLDIANFNSPTQTVISGPSEDVKRAEPLLQKEGVQLYIPLPVSAAFHSRYMVTAAKAFEEFLQPLPFHELSIPVVSNVTAQPHPSHDPNGIKSLLIKQVYSPVLWLQSVQYLLGKDVSTFTEMGPGNVLSRLIQQIRS